MAKAKIGLLPLYLELYDTSMPDRRPRMEKFYGTVSLELTRRDIEVVAAPVCRLEPEFKDAIGSFEEASVDAVVTLHLAYSPSLQSAGPLAATSLPIVVLDTSPTFDFSPTQEPDEIMYNHGIHGVQDMCNLLIRNRKPFRIEAGHWQESDVLDRVAAHVRSARLAANMRRARVGRIGPAFEGMGDFAVPADELRQSVGVETIPCDADTIRSLLPAPDAAEVEAEMAEDRSRFAVDGLDPEAHRRSTCVCLAVRRWIEKEQLTAFTVNFLAVNRASGLPTVPFLEASKGMARGLGYAGEGDVLTASLVGALASVYADTTFTEVFCADWSNDAVFLSHMGEMNLDLVAGKPQLIEKPFPWTDADNPAVAVGCFRAGRAMLVNLAPGPDGSYSLVIAPVEMLDVTGEDKMAGTIHGWFRPALSVPDFLAEYSRAGGTHHSALVYGEAAGEIAGFGEMMGWTPVLIQ